MSVQNIRTDYADRAESLLSDWGFNEETPEPLVARYFRETAAQLRDKQVLLDAMFDQYDQNGFGAIYQNRSGQYGFVLPDASIQGAFRYQLFDARGFFAHSTFSTVDEAIYELCDYGCNRLALPDTLLTLSSTREWKFSTEALALRTAVESGRYSYAEGERLYASLVEKYDPDLWAA